MPKTYTIDLSFRSTFERPFLNRPERVKVARGTVVEWRLKLNDESFYRLDRYYPYGVSFTVHFDSGTPFEWIKETYHLGLFFSLRPFPQSIILASGQADKPGDYKYGIQIRQSDNNENIDDDDPFLKVI